MTTPLTLAEVTGRRWDAVVVGAGHNGLTAAAYLARAGWSVLVLERRDQLGGACTLETPFADERFVVSPCAYLVGLLHPLVVEELGLRRRGYRVQPVDPHLWCPFDDGTALALWDDPARTAASMAEIAPGDVGSAGRCGATTPKSPTPGSARPRPERRSRSASVTTRNSSRSSSTPRSPTSSNAM